MSVRSLASAAMVAAFLFSCPALAGVIGKDTGLSWVGNTRAASAHWGPITNMPSHLSPELTLAIVRAETASAQGVQVASGSRWHFGAGRYGVIVGRQTIPWGNIARGIQVAGRAVMPIVTAAAVAEWLADNMIGVEPDGSWYIREPGSDTVPGSGVWKMSDPAWPYGYSTPAGACKAYIVYFNARFNGSKVYQGVRQNSPTQYFCDAVGHAGFGMIIVDGSTCPDGSIPTASTGYVCPTGETKRPATWDEVYPRLRDGVPDNAPESGPRIWQEVTEGGGQIEAPADPPTVSGPTQVQGPTSTQTGPQGTTVVNVTYHITYQGNTVTVTERETRTNPDGTQEVEEREPEPQPELPPDPDLPPVPDLYERKYPDGLKGVWEVKKAAFLQSPLFQLIPGLTPAFGDAGCPVWTLPLGPWGTHDVSLPCWVWSAMRLIFICTALFTARKLVFGG